MYFFFITLTMLCVVHINALPVPLSVYIKNTISPSMYEKRTNPKPVAGICTPDTRLEQILGRDWNQGSAYITNRYIDVPELEKKYGFVHSQVRAGMNNEFSEYKNKKYSWISGPGWNDNEAWEKAFANDMYACNYNPRGVPNTLKIDWEQIPYPLAVIRQ